MHVYLDCQRDLYILLIIQYKKRQQVDMRSQQPDPKSPVFPSPKFSPSPLKKQHPLPTLITSIAKEQQHTLSTLSQKCSIMEYAVAQLEVLTAQVAERVQKWNEAREKEMLGSLKIKQAEFIIGELRSSLGKQVKKEQRLLQQISAEKRRNEGLRQQNSKLQAKCTSLSQKVTVLEGTLRKKAELWQSSNTTMLKIRNEHENEVRNRKKSFNNKQSVSIVRNSEEYGELQAKIEELEKEFNNQIQKLVNKNNQLSFQVKKYKDGSTEMTNVNKLMRKQLEELSRNKYELQIKARQDQIQMAQLEQMYGKLVQKSNNSEIMLHKQLQEYKVKQLQLRNQFKKEKKGLKMVLSTIAEYINNSKYYFTANQIKDQAEQLKKLFDKSLKKKLENFIRELEYYQAQHKKIKTRNDELERKVTLLQKTKPAATSAKDLQGQMDKIQKASENGSLLHNRSHDRSEQEKRSVQDKFKSKLQALRKDVKTKQSKINELEKMQQIQFDKNKQKILQLQMAISEKTNEIRKLQLKFKERQYQFGEYQLRINQLQVKIKFLTEKLQGEKESNSKMLQIKIQNYEEKLKIIKNNYKQLERKQQEKTIKYNKLKSRYEKYQLEASESLKRKNAQIDQLLKENNKYKSENRLLEEKININTIIQTQISKNKTPTHSAVNQDLIEQIQMERDRISGQLVDKQKKCSNLMDNNERLTVQITGIRKELRELKSKIQEMAREERFLRQENKYAKEKIQQLTKNNQQQDETKHNYLKKQLQKSVLNVKKLEKAGQKYVLQRQQRKKQLQQKMKQIQSLKGQIQKLKQKRGKLQSQLQDERQSKKRLIIDYDRRLSECTAKEQQLVQIINYKNRQGDSGEIRLSMKGEELIIQQQKKIKFNMDTMTDTIITREKAINTDPIEHHVTHYSLNHHQKQIIPSELILDNDYELDILEKSIKQQSQPQSIKQKQRQNPKVINYFGDLIMNQNEQDHFQICDDGQQVLQRVSVNSQLKQMFNLVRQSIQKVFNQQDISITTVKQLPKQLQEDFNDFISYIKEKIAEIENENNLTFIMAEGGNEPEDIQTQLHEFLSKPTKQYIKMKKIIEEKEYMITSLMNEKTEQQNTINQQQNIQEQGQRLHLQQYSVLKSEIHEQKLALDKQQLYYESLKNIIKKMMNFWIQDDDNYDDFQDNLQLITTIYKFNAKQMELLKLYLKKYRQLKQID